MNLFNAPPSRGIAHAAKLKAVADKDMTDDKLASMLLEITENEVVDRSEKITKEELHKGLFTVYKNFSVSLGLAYSGPAMMLASPNIISVDTIREVAAPLMSATAELCILSEVVKSFKDGRFPNIEEDSNMIQCFTLTTTYCMSRAFEAQQWESDGKNEPAKPESMLNAILMGTEDLAKKAGEIFGTLFEALEKGEFEDDMPEIMHEKIRKAIATSIALGTFVHRLLDVSGLIDTFDFEKSAGQQNAGLDRNSAVDAIVQMIADTINDLG